MKNQRNTRGNMLLFIACITAIIFIPLIIVVCKICPFFVGSGRSQNVVEAAGLLAANDLSRIVINDPTFGYISLSNFEPTGKILRARDGQPLPVTGINTLIGTIRQNAIIADLLHNGAMNALIDKDLNSLKGTINHLNSKLQDSISELDADMCSDMDGNRVNVREDVKKFLAENLPSTVKLESMKLSLGWLEGGSETTISVPKPAQLAQASDDCVEAGTYQAFMNIPVGKRSFSFAGLGTQSHRVSNSKFHEADNKHINSIIKLECTLSTAEEPDAKIQCVTVCQPASRDDHSPKGAMTVRFSGRPVPGLNTWNDFLTNGSFSDNKITSFDVLGGDFPYDKTAKLKQSYYQQQTTTSQQFAEHLYNWLRNGHLRPRIDAILSMLNEPFLSGTNEIYLYEFQDDGSIKRRVFEGKDFTRAVVADGQKEIMSDTKVKSGANAVIMFRDNVKSLNVSSGKHAGQPLAGYPFNNSEGSNNHEQLAQNFSKRGQHSDGLALDIEIGGTNDSTARKDVVSMRQKTQSRKI